MYIKEEDLRQLEVLFGKPQELALQQKITLWEMNMLQSSQKNGRSHDFTFFILDENNRVAVIRKHQHHPGFYRAPSGGAEPNEDLIAAIQREALEETGLNITIDKYILRLKPEFQCNEITVPWVSHIITAKSETTLLEPMDVKEIKEAKWVRWEELQGPIRTNLKNSNLGLFHYRVRLTDTVASLLQGSLD